MNNKGSSYLMVIVCISFISLLSIVMLSLTITNAETKRINKESKANFYTLEQVIDEIYTSIGLEVMTLLKLSYSETLANAIDKDEEGKPYVMKSNAELSRKCKEALKGRISSKYVDSGVFKDILMGYIVTDVSVADKFELTIEGLSFPDSDTVVFKDLGVSYINGGYENKITTDIVINLPTINFNTGSRVASGDYPIYAGMGLRLGGNMSSSITGNMVVASNGIHLDNVSSNLSLSNRIAEQNFVAITGDIRVKPSNRFVMDAIGGFRNFNLWCNNIITEGNEAGIANIDMNGVVYVKDDLELNGENTIFNNPNMNHVSNIVKMSGEYYGYSYNNSSDSDSSAIIVNSINSSLDLSDLDKLYVAGNAYIDIGDAGIVTGESVALKGNQDIYLVPVSCITIEGKPATSNPYSASLTNAVVEFTDEFKEEIKDNLCVAEFSDIIIGNEAKTVNNILLGENLVYNYLIFADSEAASKYFEYMNSKNGALTFVESILTKFNIANLSLPSSGNIETVGIATDVKRNPNITTYSLQPNPLMKDIDYKQNTKYFIENGFTEVVNMNNYFDMGKISSINDELLIIVDNSGVSRLIKPTIEPVTSSDFSSAKSIIVITNQNLSTGITWWNTLCENIEDEVDGIILSTQNVDINFKYNKIFNGLIYAGGQLTISRPGGGTTDKQSINVDYSAIQNLLDICGIMTYDDIIGEDQYIADLFNYTPNVADPSPGGISIERYSYKDFMNYDNWRKK